MTARWWIRSIVMIGIVCLGLLATRYHSHAALAGSITVLSPSGAPGDVLPEGDDYFTLVLGDPRDMNQRLDLRYQHLNVTNITVQNGLWRAYGGERVYPLFPGFTPHAADIGQTGTDHPIDGTRFRRFSMRASNTSSDRIYLVSHSGNIVDEQIAWQGPVLGDGQMHTIVGDPNVYWPESITGLRINISGHPFVIDWVRLTDPDTSPVYNIRWNASEVNYVDIYCDVDTDPTVLDHRIAARVNAAAGMFAWETGYLAPGRYYVYIRDADNPGVGAYSPGSIEIVAAPVVDITAPSRTSGPDYATDVIGNPWDMSDAADVAGTMDLSSVTFSGGQMHAVTTGEDPYITLSSAGPNTIDTSFYRYLTWRFYVEGDWADSGEKILGNVNRWGVTRLIADTGGSAFNTFNDVIPWEGWHIYQMDLGRGGGTHYLDDVSPGPGPGWNGLRSVLRLDLLEPVEHNRWPVHLDYVLLTANPRPQNGTYLIEWRVMQGGPVTTTLLYSTSPSPCETGTLIAQIAPQPAPPPTGPYRLYLPIVQSTPRYPWSTSYAWADLPSAPGEYYIKIIVEDGLQQTCWVGNAPLVIED